MTCYIEYVILINCSKRGRQSRVKDCFVAQDVNYFILNYCEDVRRSNLYDIKIFTLLIYFKLEIRDKIKEDAIMGHPPVFKQTTCYFF